MPLCPPLVPINISNDNCINLCKYCIALKGILMKQQIFATIVKYKYS